MFGALFFLFGLWIVSANITYHTNRLPLPSLFAGGLMGASFSMAIVESGSPWLGFLAAACLLMCSAVRILDSRASSVIRAVSVNPLVCFGITFSVTISLGLMLYYFFLGSFVQPSEIGGIPGVIEKVFVRFHALL